MSAKAGWREVDAKAHESMTRFFTRSGWEPTSMDMPFARMLDLPLDGATPSLFHFIENAGNAFDEDDARTKHEEWTRLQLKANTLLLSGTATEEERSQAERAANDFYRDHETDICRAMEAGPRQELNSDTVKERMLGAMAMFDFLMARGVTPMDFYRQFTAAGRALYREPFSLMTSREIAMMEGQSHAAHVFRCQLMSGEIELAGMKGSKLAGQKSKEARESYRLAQQGNKNRLGGKKAAAKTARKQRQQSFLKRLKIKPVPKK